MSTDALKDKLKELHLTLESTESPDEELVKLLQVLDRDIQSLIVKQEPNIADSENLATRAQTLSAGFAIKHPHLAPVLRELTDMLASIGI